MSLFSRSVRISIASFGARAFGGRSSYQEGLRRWSAASSQVGKLADIDHEIFNLLQLENKRQETHLNLIASENFMSSAVLEALGSIVQNKSSEGYPGARYHSCCVHIDAMEQLCQSRALQLFNLQPEEWGVNVQAMSGSNANLYVYSALLNCHDRIMGMEIAHGGHLSHGYRRGAKKISMVSKYFESLPYHLDPETGLIDYDSLEDLAQLYRPKIIVAGTSAYSRLIDYARMHRIAAKTGAYLMSDISHISGLIASGLIPSPFEYSDIVTSSTAKTLRGPRGGIIFYRRRARATAGAPGIHRGDTHSIADAINSAVFPGHQNSPHNNTTAALAVALHLARTPEFKEYQRWVLLNAKALADTLVDLGYTLVSGGTENHLVLLDLRPHGLDGARLESVLELLGVASNKNMLLGDKSAKEPSGLRLGSPAMTSRGLRPGDFTQIAQFIHRAVKLTATLRDIAEEHAKAAGERQPESLECFKQFVIETRTLDMITKLRREIMDWVSSYDGGFGDSLAMVEAS